MGGGGGGAGGGGGGGGGGWGGERGGVALYFFPWPILIFSFKNTQGNRISGYRRLLDFGSEQMISCSDSVCNYPVLLAYILNI